MRYRPLGNTGMSISAMSLLLADSRRADDGRRTGCTLVYAALENGINAFEVAAGSRR